MAWRVYEVREKDRDRLAVALAIDRVSRASIQLRDARHFGWERETTYVVLEGTEEQVQAADRAILVYGRVPANAEAIWRRVRWEDEASASSLGRVLSRLPPPEFKVSEEEKRRALVAELAHRARAAARRMQRGVRRLRRKIGL